MRMTLSNCRRSGAAVALLFASAMGAGLAGAQEKAVELRLLSSWNPSTNGAAEIAIDRLTSRVDELSDGRVKIRFSGPGAVPAFRQFDAVNSGVFDLLFSHPAYHTDAISIGVGGDLAVGSAAVRRDCGLTQEINAAYRDKTGVAYVAEFPVGYGYRLYLSEKPGSGDQAFQGLRIRGTEFYNPIIQGLGGSPVKVSSSEAYSAAQRGIIDGAFNGEGAEGTFKMSLHEVVDYQLEPSLGETVYVLFANAQIWDELDDEAREVLEKAIEETQEYARQEASERDVEYQEKLNSAGIQVVNLEGSTEESYERYYYEGIAEKFVLQSDSPFGQRVMDALGCVRDEGKHVSTDTGA